MKIAVIVLDGSYASSVFGLTDALEVANAHCRRAPELARFESVFKWSFVKTPATRYPTYRGGARLRPDASMDSAAEADVVYLPGVNYAGAEEFKDWVCAHHKLLPTLVELHNNGVELAANCTSTFLLAEAGLLEQKRATTTWWLEQQFRNAYPKVQLDVKRALTHDDGIYCVGAMTAYHQLALRLIERAANPGIATMTAKTMLLTQGFSEQLHFQALNHNTESGDPLVSKVQYWLRSHLSDPVDFSKLAREMSITQKTLIKRFKESTGITPLVFLQNERVEVAKTMLANSTLPIVEITDSVGYQDVSAFTRLFKRKVGLTPSSYRAGFHEPSFKTLR